ncbi:hypothetical protein T4D_2405 [Trichinella pseudospiralis]|uniref:Uncharacterized protein n=1 Tax=Trichinella pseudospiralis TaxID=6337 RepID=A0A0V1FEI8_TRIPS|nr:hypothetical protein T4D_2405 [Trichinella pseudospiralis]
MLATQLCQLAVDCIISDAQARRSHRLTAKPKSRLTQGKQSQVDQINNDCLTAIRAMLVSERDTKQDKWDKSVFINRRRRRSNESQHNERAQTHRNER